MAPCELSVVLEWDRRKIISADGLTILHNVAVTCGVILLVAAALHDVAARTVPNCICGLVAVAGFVARLIDRNLPVSIAVALTLFVLSALCWRRGWMGGGDVKLLGAVALLVPPASVAILVVDVALAGGILAVTYLALYAIVPRRTVYRAKPRSVPARALRVERWRISRRGPIPYASAIAAGALFCLWGE